MKEKELKRIRTDLGLTQSEMARVLGLSSSGSYARIERGERNITRSIAKLAKLAGVALAKRPGARAKMIEILKEA